MRRTPGISAVIAHGPAPRDHLLKERGLDECEPLAPGRHRLKAVGQDVTDARYNVPLGWNRLTVETAESGDSTDCPAG